jgi:hypothetical protein
MASIEKLGRLDAAGARTDDRPSTGTILSSTVPSLDICAELAA